MKCARCGEDWPMFQISGGLCKRCRDQGAENEIRQLEERGRAALATAATSDDFAKIPASVMDEASSHILLTTAPNLPDHSLYEVLQIITAEAAMGMHIFKDIATAWRDTFGGRAKSVQNTLREARLLVLTELRREAFMLKADAVIGIDLDYSEFGAHGGMLFVVASGTAIVRPN